MQSLFIYTVESVQSEGTVFKVDSLKKLLDINRTLTFDIMVFPCSEEYVVKGSIKEVESSSIVWEVSNGKFRYSYASKSEIGNSFSSSEEGNNLAVTMYNPKQVEDSPFLTAIKTLLLFDTLVSTKYVTPAKMGEIVRALENETTDIWEQEGLSLDKTLKFLEAEETQGMDLSKGTFIKILGE